MKQLATFRVSHVVSLVEPLAAVLGAHLFAWVCNNVPLFWASSILRATAVPLFFGKPSFFNSARETDRCQAFHDFKAKGHAFRCGFLLFGCLVRFNCAPNSLNTSAVYGVETRRQRALSLITTFACSFRTLVRAQGWPRSTACNCAFICPFRSLYALFRARQLEVVHVS